MARDPSGFLVIRGRGATTIFESQTALELVAEMVRGGSPPALLCDLVDIDELPYPTTIVLLVDKLEELGVFTAGVVLVLKPYGQTRLGLLAVDHAVLRGLPVRAFTRYEAAREWLVEHVAEKRA